MDRDKDNDPDTKKNTGTSIFASRTQVISLRPYTG